MHTYILYVLLYYVNTFSNNENQMHLMYAT